MLKLELKDDAVLAALSRLAEGMEDMTQPMNRIGNHLVESTMGRFGAEISPEGAPWAARSPVTIARYLAAKPPAGFGGILHKTGQLGGEIKHEYGPDFVEVGSSRPYAAVMQFGAAQGAFGRTSRNGPIPWGDIPARPFIGLSEADETGILEIVTEWLDGLAGNSP